MSGSRMLDLPEEWAIPINTLVDLVRDQTTTTLKMADRIARQKVVSKSATGHKAPRLTRLAGMYAAAAIVLSLEKEPVAYRTWWDQAILDVVTPEVLTSWDFDQRTYAALALRATFKDLPTPYPPETLEARLLASWFLHTTGPSVPRTTARLAAHVLEQHVHRAPDLWAAVHDQVPSTSQAQVPADQDTARVVSVEQLTALPAETLLRSERPGYGPTYLLTYDAGDGEVMFTTAGGYHPGFLSATEALEELGPFQVVHLPFGRALV